MGVLGDCCLKNGKSQNEKGVEKTSGSDIIETSNEEEGIEVHSVCKIDKEKLIRIEKFCRKTTNSDSDFDRNSGTCLFVNINRI